MSRGVFVPDRIRTFLCNWAIISHSLSLSHSTLNWESNSISRTHINKNNCSPCHFYGDGDANRSQRSPGSAVRHDGFTLSFTASNISKRHFSEVRQLRSGVHNEEDGRS